MKPPPHTHHILHIHLIPEHPDDQPSGHIEDSEPRRSLDLPQPLPFPGMTVYGAV